MRTMWPSVRRDDSGMTLIELLVAMMIMGIVATITFTALISSYGTVGHVDDEYQGMTDLKAVVERLSRDLRAARGVEPSPASNKNTLVIWIDRDSNYRRSNAEIITWKIEGASVSGRYDVVREDRTGARQVVGRSVVSDVGFRYAGPGTSDPLDDTATATSNRVSVTLSYDAIPGIYSSDQVVGFDVRMRNVA